ncbi:MAG: hypothetical protein GY898_20360 [Proteobacteria bacterium]|nr:hypothetical protein [Pseudomonadota bacterium]
MGRAGPSGQDAEPCTNAALRGRVAVRRGAREAAQAAALFAKAGISEASPGCRDLHALRAELA